MSHLAVQTGTASYRNAYTMAVAATPTGSPIAAHTNLRIVATVPICFRFTGDGSTGADALDCLLPANTVEVVGTGGNTYFAFVPASGTAGGQVSIATLLTDTTDLG